MGLDLTPGPLAGLFIIDLDVRSDEDRPGGSFREVFHAAKLNALGLPQFTPVQWNVSESTGGTLRGLHAEPWNKLVHIVAGRAFSCIADIRADSPTVGETWTGELDSSRALFVGAGLANGFQALSDVVVYAYLVDQHWSADVSYPAVAWDDPDLAVPWPITDDRLSMSKKDRNNPTLQEHRSNQSALT
jgi:dTDP-4-dehydrorhamnose 3,5-epimerase/reductase